MNADILFFKVSLITALYIVQGGIRIPICPIYHLINDFFSKTASN